jgi:putative ABC transport system ATP-binding protein
MIKTVGLKKLYRADEVETGPSGCGKSTLLNVLGMLDNPSDGEYHFLGHDIAHYTERQRAGIRKQNIGFVFQSFNLIDELSVYENIELPLLYLKVPGSDRKARVEELLEKMNIVPRRNHFPQQLSGGQQQRVAVARAIVAKPKLILADEPTGNLDSAHGEEVMKMLTDLNAEGTAVMMVTHSPIYADYAQRIIHLYDGHVVTENVMRAPHA